ncbi:MAG: hypothetical protein BM549_04685 [Lacinutrix sp. MedPE-SW]|nr:hypothetical protein [uncultured Lacinutrix sp.]OIQ23315.1 MAG: hypothetical protein BM549_04685 [Lacinutrix sp. MedPE-SW]
MARFKYVITALFFSVFAFLSTESDPINAIKKSFPQQTVQANTASQYQGIIVNSNLEIVINSQPETNNSFFKKLGLLNVEFKEQQAHYLVYQSISQYINVGLSKTQIIYPFHWFT